MKNLLIALAMGIAVSSQATAEECVPCGLAEHIVGLVNPSLPIAITERTSMYEAEAKDNTVIFRVRYDYTHEELKELAKQNGVPVGIVRLHVQASAQALCAADDAKAFLTTGGRYVYEYYFSDGELFADSKLEKCPASS